MYDWNALWHQHRGYRTGYFDPAAEDINDLETGLGARLIKPASDHSDIAVYENDDGYHLVGHDNGLQMLTLGRHALFDVAVRFVSRPENQLPVPCIEVRAGNLASGESACWYGDIRKDEQGQIWLDNTLLSEGVMPPMPFDDLTFTDNARFRDILYAAWQRVLPTLVEEIGRWTPDAEQQLTISARYAVIMRYEQTRLRHRFSTDERALIAEALRDVALNEADECRGLWLHVERWWLSSTSERDLGDLLTRLRALDPAEEFALIELL
jgi:hypothetical protein